MENNIHYLELSKDFIKFDGEGQLTNLFFDESNKQMFIVRSNGTLGVVVKRSVDDTGTLFCINTRSEPIRAIKFSPDNQVLAVLRKENALELVCFQGEQPLLRNIITYQVKTLIYGFVWVHNRELALITNTGIEIFQILPEKRQVRSVKALSISIKWFVWSCDSNIALVCTTGNTLLPVQVNRRHIAKLPKVDLGAPVREVDQSQVTMAKVYDMTALLILQCDNSTGMKEVEVHLLNGPGLASRKCHVLRLSLTGLFAINTVDNLIVVHHQASATSLIFDIALSGEVINEVTYHFPITQGRSIKPFGLRLPSLSPDGQILQCELYSPKWVFFQPNIVIDIKLGCMWYLNLSIEPFMYLISDRVRLTDFLLKRSYSKPTLLKVLQQLVDKEYKYTPMIVLETIFDNINSIYDSWLRLEFTNLLKASIMTTTIAAQVKQRAVFIGQSDMVNIFQNIAGRSHTEAVLMLYLQSLNKYKITVQKNLSKIIVEELIRNHSFDTLRRLVQYSMIMESRSIGNFLLKHYYCNPAISQIAIEILKKVKAYDIIADVWLKQGKIIDALRLTNSTMPLDRLAARKFLEAAYKTGDDSIFYSVYRFFQMQNLRSHGNVNFRKADQCSEYILHYNAKFSGDNASKLHLGCVL